MTTVLIIEDEKGIRRLLRTALEGDSVRVFEAEDLARGLVEAATRKPDLVILDLGLPDGDGITFVQEFRQWSSVPVLVLSARDSEHDKIAALDAGADDYMTKPFGVGELQARLRVLMRRYPGSEKMILFMNSGISVWILPGVRSGKAGRKCISHRLNSAC